MFVCVPMCTMLIPATICEGSLSSVYLRMEPSLVTMPTHVIKRHPVYFNEFIFKRMFALHSMSAVYTL